MSSSINRCIGIGLLVAFTSDVDAADWERELTAVLWASGLEGTQSVGPVSVDVDAAFSDLLEFVDAGGALRMTAQRDEIGWFIEASYVELSDEIAGAVDTEFGQTIAEGGLSYDIAEHFAVYGGARYQALDLEIRLAASQTIRRDTDWVDAIAGIRWMPRLGNAWVPWVRGDIGTGGSDFQWLAEAGVTWRLADTWSTQVAYRALDVDYESDGFAYDMRQSGLMLGLSIRF
jgi:opacity protein-like surface antigen